MAIGNCIMDPEIIPLGSGDITPRPPVKAIGIGGAGHNILKDCFLDKVALCTSRDAFVDPTVPAYKLDDSDVQFLNSITPELIGTLNHASLDKICRLISDMEMVSVFSGLGGETGSRITPLTSYACKKSTALAVSSVAIPFSAEGQARKRQSATALPTIVKHSHITISYPNDGLLKLAPDLPLQSALKVMNFFMTKPILDMAGIITKDDVSTIKTNLNRSHMRVGIGRGGGTWGEEAAIQEALTSPWFDFDLYNVERALMIISAPKADEYTFKNVMKYLSPKIPHSKILYWAVPTQDDNAESEVTLLLDCSNQQ